MKKLIKAVMLLHRYLGFVLSLMFVMWFLSGFVMMYVSYPTMKYHQRLQQLAVINMEQCRLHPEQAINSVGITDTISTMHLGMLLNRPVYRIVTKLNRHVAVYADNGAVVDKIDSALAGEIVKVFVHDRSRPVSVSKLYEIDQWMAAYRYQGYLPEVYRFVMDDDAYVYVSVYTGEVVQMVSARQRFWAWIGPVPHWIYPTILIRNRPLWSQVVIWISLTGTVMCLAGILMGIIRFKRKKKGFSPYKKKWFRYHHYLGFVFGVFVFTWILSGLLSMSPVDFGPDGGRLVAERQMLSGGAFSSKGFVMQPAIAASKFRPLLAVKEIQLIQLDGRPYYLAYQDGDHTLLLAADEEANKPFAQFSAAFMLDKVQSLQPGIPVLETVVMNSYDNYYYSRTFEKRLPVLRVKMNNAAQSWYYVDLKTGQLVLKHEQGSRLERWLYHGLHSLDIGFLFYKRPLWDIVMWVLLLGGTLLSLTGAVLTWKWIRRKTL